MDNRFTNKLNVLSANTVSQHVYLIYLLYFEKIIDIIRVQWNKILSYNHYKYELIEYAYLYIFTITIILREFRTFGKNTI